MATVWICVALIAAFVISHVVLATEPLRGQLVARLGIVGFTGLYSVIAWITFGALVFWYSGHRAEGPLGLGLGGLMWVRAPAMAMMAVGVVFMVVCPIGYVKSAQLVFSDATPGPSGMERITRHTFFVGMTLFGTGHALVSTHLIGTVVFGGLALLALAGSWLLDRKLLARRGAEYATYLDQTSTMPMWAVLTGRQRLVLSELPWITALGGAGLAALTWTLHGTGFQYGAHLLLAALIVLPSGFFVAGLSRRRREQEQGPSAAHAPRHGKTTVKQDPTPNSLRT